LVGRQGTSAESEQPAADTEPTDHVERVRALWARERPDLDTSPIAVIARLGRARGYLEYGIDRHLDQFGLSRPAWDVLASLRRAGAPFRLSPTELYRGLMRTSGALTRRLEHLDREGLIARVPDPTDGRSLLVELTPRGRELVDRVAASHLDNERRLLAALSAGEQEILAGLLSKLLVALERDLPYPPPRSRTGGARDAAKQP
jgi:DNA-binding MarR family transcriptional regulator